MVARVTVFTGAPGVLPADPIGAVGAVLAFPDRDRPFDTIDERPAGAEGLAAVDGARDAEDGDVPDRKRTDAMLYRHADAGEVVHDGRFNARNFRFGHCVVGVVFELSYRSSVIEIADNAVKNINGAGTRVGNRSKQWLNEERLF
jgi:hypothetical protein